MKGHVTCQIRGLPITSSLGTFATRTKPDSHFGRSSPGETGNVWYFQFRSMMSLSEPIGLTSFLAIPLLRQGNNSRTSSNLLLPDSRRSALFLSVERATQLTNTPPTSQCDNNDGRQRQRRQKSSSNLGSPREAAAQPLPVSPKATSARQFRLCFSFFFFVFPARGAEINTTTNASGAPFPSTLFS